MGLRGWGRNNLEPQRVASLMIAVIAVMVVALWAAIVLPQSQVAPGQSVHDSAPDILAQY